MYDYDSRLNQAFCAGRTDVILIEDLHHASSCLTEDASDVEDGQYQAGQNQMPRRRCRRMDTCVIHTAHGKDTQSYSEYINHNQTGKEGRCGSAYESQSGRNVIPCGVRLVC